MEVLLVHSGGPFWTHCDEGVWSIPKGEFGDDEAPLDAPIREVEEETGSRVTGEFVALSPIRQPKKTVFAWAVEADFYPAALRSNTFSLQYPPNSGHFRRFPEVDRASWFDVGTAKVKIRPAQVPLVVELWERHNVTGSEP